MSLLAGASSPLVTSAIWLGYSEQVAHCLVGILNLRRVVTDAKHRAYRDKPESEKVESLIGR